MPHSCDISMDGLMELSHNSLVNKVDVSNSVLKSGCFSCLRRTIFLYGSDAEQTKIIQLKIKELENKRI
jgi:hypothetical protein